MASSGPPPEKVRFTDMPLSKEAQAGLEALGYEFATPVQAAVFEHAMAGKDLMVQSKTGTGKTTAFGLPLVEKIRMEGATDPQALVLCPTRELANQVAEELAELGDPKGVRVLPIYGGAPMGPQLKSLKAGCDVVVGTPGRVLDHIRRRTLRLVHAHLAVLDEADEMLSMGFWEDVTAILQQLPDARQTLLFSATLPDQIRKTALGTMHDPETIDISRDELTVEGIVNLAYEADDRLPKPRNLLYVLEVERPENAVVFCNTRDDAATVAAFLRRQGLHALALSGELNQRDRERVMRRMKSGELQYLVATDIAARGIDISDLSHVVNYSLPEFTEVYLHRVGRTGRAGKRGTAVSLVAGRDQMTFTQLQREFGIEFEMKTLPDFKEIVARQAERVALELQKEARDTEVTSFLRLAEHLLQAEPAVEAVAYLLKQYFWQLEEARTRDPLEQAGAREDEETEPAPERAPRARRERSGDREDGRKRKKKGKDKDRDRSEPAEPSLQDGVRLFVNRGSIDGYDERRLRTLVAQASGLQEGIGRIQLRRTHSFVEVSPEVMEAAVAAANAGLEREDKPVNMEPARTRG
ncbi:MAG TPA: DEAD/DEAH box helicase [Myxococcales bacterium LLY-WYZ-16_1]|jgi:ATP-dependent RNA helicase DeaD|nr:DEAD/DEAH box helicase [Myxococcales bacterium LLY-WYZ-16_1]